MLELLSQLKTKEFTIKALKQSRDPKRPKTLSFDEYLSTTLINFLKLLFQDRRGWPEERTEEVDPLFRGRPPDHVRGSHQRVRPGAGGGH